MRTHTANFKNELVQFGREFDDIITYNGETLSKEEIKSVNYSVKSSLMKSVMKELKIDTTTEMTKGDSIGYQLGLRVGNSFEYLNFGSYIVDKVEKQEDKRSWLVTCYDKMLLTMVDYVDLSEYQLTEDTEFEENKIYYELEDDEYVVYDGDRTGNPTELELYELASIFPLTIREYIGKICNHFGITFANANDTFINYDKTLSNELYLDSNGNTLGYTFRDVLDQLAQATGSFICINNDNELEVRYITEAIAGDSASEVEYTFTTSITSGSNFVISNTNSVDTAKSLNNDISYVSLSTEVAPSSNGWIFTASGTGYTIKNKETGLFLGLSSSNTLTTSETEYVWTWSSGNRRLSTQSTGGFTRTYYLRFSNSTWQVSTTAGSIYLATYTGGEQERDEINENYFNDTNVNIGKKYGPINSLIFSRSADSDNIGVTDDESIATNGLCEIKISDNQILNDNNRSDYLDDLFEYLDGIYYYLNDYDLKGVLYYEVGDMYNVSIFGNTYQCLMLNDEINRSPGVKETIYSEEPETSVSDYKSISKTDKTINQTYLIVNKQEGQIESLVSRTDTIDTTVNNNYQELNDKFNGYVPTSQFVTLENSVHTLETDTYTKTEINTKLVDGSVEKVMTTAGTFDIDGMHYEKTNAPTSTTINEVGVGVKKTSDTDYVLFAGYVDSNNTQYSDFEGQTIVATENILVENYLVVGDKSRFENYEDGTGCFYIGG